MGVDALRKMENRLPVGPGSRGGRWHDPEFRRAYHRAWRRAHPEYCERARLQRARRRASLSGVDPAGIELTTAKSRPLPRPAGPCSCSCGCTEITGVDDFTCWVRLRVAEIGWSQRRLASATGIDHSAISRLITGHHRDPLLSTAVALANVLGAYPGAGPLACGFCRDGIHADV